MTWNNTLYDQKHDFVSKYGVELVELLGPKEGEMILDLGCGTGDLADALAQGGAQVVGIDESEEMVAAAKKKFPQTEFLTGDARELALEAAGIQEGRLDGVFSNAVLHWIKEPERVLKNVNKYLKIGGRFVGELGGEGNVRQIRKAIHEVLVTHDYPKQAAIQKWYFPSVAAYAELLEKYGFEIRLIGTFDRPTELRSTQKGVIEWLEMFGASFFEGIEDNKKETLLYEIQNRLEPVLHKRGRWVADYKRLRFCAIKTKEARFSESNVGQAAN